MGISVPKTSTSHAPLDALAETRLYDLALRLPLAAFYLLVLIAKAGPLARAIVDLPAHGFPLLPVAQVLAHVAFLLFITLMVGVTVFRRRAVAKSQGMWGRLLALGACALPMTLPLLPHQTPSVAMLLTSAALVMLGNIGCVLTMTWLGRSFSIMPEARRAVMAGPYSVIRHPLYVCEQVALLGAILLFFSPYAPILFVVQIAIQIGRMHYEERVLAATFPDYAAYMARTYRLVPGVY